MEVPETGVGGRAIRIVLSSMADVTRSLADSAKVRMWGSIMASVSATGWISLLSVEMVKLVLSTF